MHLPASSFTVGLLFATAASAQTTWIVDQRGTGNFTDLAPAFATARDGDVIVIRGGGRFVGPYSLTKSLALRADAPRPSVLNLQVQGGSRGQVSIAGVDMAPMSIANCTVPVALEDVHASLCQITGCPSVTLVRSVCDGRSTGIFNAPGLVVSNSTVAIDGCQFFGGDPACPFGNPFPDDRRPGLRAQSSSLEIVRSTLTGGAGMQTPCGTGRPGPGLWLQSSDVLISRSTVAPGAGGTATAAVDTSTSTVVADPTTQFAGGFAGALVRIVPAAGGQGGAPGAPIAFELDGPAGLPAILAIAPGLGRPVPFPRGHLWLDLDHAIPVAIGITDAAGRLAAGTTIPPTIGRGLVIGVQGAVVQAGTTLTLSTPSVVFVR